MADPGECVSLSANRYLHARDFSLIGRTVRPGDQISCRAWLWYTKLDTFDRAIDKFRQLVETT
jgi:hypothetical protein